jgi:FkbM family methyltransferase
MVFYDLGTNLGFYSLIAARQVGPAGHVYGFEPDPEIAQRVRSNLNHNGFKNFTHIEAAVWRETGTVAFARSDESSSPDRGTGQIAMMPRPGQTVEVPAIALDDFVKSARPPYWPNGILRSFAKFTRPKTESRFGISFFDSGIEFSIWTPITSARKPAAHDLAPRCAGLACGCY